VEQDSRFHSFSERRFGRWLVIKAVDQDACFHLHVICRCDCGTEKEVCTAGLRAGRSRSCGCLNARRTAEMGRRNVKHGDTIGGHASIEYRTWVSMIQRCHNPNQPAYAQYGARGITVCERWRSSFSAFLEDMGRKPTPSHSIERKDSSKDYEPCNCRWATMLEQQRNRRSNRLIEIDGINRCVAEWAEMFRVVSADTTRHRLDRGWPPHEAFVQPV